MSANEHQGEDEHATESERVELLQEFLASGSAEEGASGPAVQPDEDSPAPTADNDGALNNMYGDIQEGGHMRTEMMYAMHAQQQFQALAEHESPPAPYPYTDPYMYPQYQYPPYPYQPPYPPVYPGYNMPPPHGPYDYGYPAPQHSPPRTRSQESMPQQTTAEVALNALSADSGDIGDDVVIEGEDTVLQNIDNIVPEAVQAGEDQMQYDEQQYNEQFINEQQQYQQPYPYPVDPNQMMYMYPYPPVGPDGQPLPPAPYPYPYPYPYGYPPAAYPPPAGMPPQQTVYSDYDKAKKAISPNLDQVLEAIEIRHDRINVDTMTDEIKYELDCELYVALGFFFQSEEGLDLQQSDPKLYHQLEDEYDRVLKVYYKGQGHETAETMCCCVLC